MGNGLCQSPCNTPLNLEHDNLIRCLFYSPKLTCDFVSRSATSGHIRSLVSSSSQIPDGFLSDNFWISHRDPTLQPKFDIVWNCCWNNTRLLLKEPTGSANNTDVKRISKFYISFYQCLAQINHSYAYIYCIYIYTIDLCLYLYIYIYI